MNFMFRLGSHPQDVHYVYSEYSNLQKYLESETPSGPSILDKGDTQPVFLYRNYGHLVHNSWTIFPPVALSLVLSQILNLWVERFHKKRKKNLTQSHSPHNMGFCTSKN